MKMLFKKGFFGYKKVNVDEYIKKIKMDYEDDLSKQRERIVQLDENNRKLKEEIERLSNIASKYDKYEKHISGVLLKAEEKAQAIINEGHFKARQELEKLHAKRSKYKDQFDIARKQLIDFEQKIIYTMDKFQADVNYLTSQDLMSSLASEEKETGEQWDVNALNKDITEETLDIKKPTATAS